MRKFHTFFILIAFPFFAEGQTVTKVTSFFQIMKTMEKDLPKNWEIWDWTMEEQIENGNLPAIHLEFVYRTPGLKELNTSVAITFYEKKDEETCNAFYKNIKEKGEVVKTIETKESIGYIYYEKDKQKKGNQKELISFLEIFFGKHSEKM